MTDAGHGADAVAPLPGVTAPVLTPGPSSAFATSLGDFWADRRRPVRAATLAGCAVVGCAGGVLLVGQRLGLGLALVGLLLWVPAVAALLRRRAWGDLVLAGLSVALVGGVAVRDSGWVVALSVLTAVGVAAVAATSGRSAPSVLLAPLGGAAGAVRALPWVARGIGGHLGARRERLLTVVRSVAVTVVLLVVFGALFAAADGVFASYLPSLDLDLLPGRVVVGVMVGVAAATLAHLALAPPSWSRLTAPAGRAARRGEWLLPVLALDAMVLAFVLVQVGALVGGHGYVRRTAGLSYAEYARQGFGQLLAATALTLVVVAVAARRAPRETSGDRLMVRAALGVLCLATLGVVASALRRMALYVDAFGLTELRILAVFAEIVLGVVLVLLIVAGIRWRARWLPRAVVHVVAVAMLGLALLNPDALIVRHNTAASLDIPLDVYHLQSLSADAVPAIDALDEPLRSCLLGDGRSGSASGDGGATASGDGFAGWNLSRARAAEVFGAQGPRGTDADASACAAYRTMEG